MKPTTRITLLAATLAAAASGNASAYGYADPASFSDATGTLTIPMVGVFMNNEYSYYSATLGMSSTSPIAFSITSLTELTPDPETYTSNYFDPSTSMLSLYDVEVALGQRNYQYSIDLTLSGGQFVLGNLTDNTYIRMDSPVMPASYDYYSMDHQLPVETTCDGTDLSPQLSWTSAPEGTVSYAIYVHDVNAGASGYDTWNHWLVANIPADTTTYSHTLASGYNAQSAAPDGGVNGLNDWGETGYRGPCPPAGSGEHTYYFKVYALDTLLNLSDGFSYSEFQAASSNHVLQETSVYGTYSRN